MHTRQFQPPQSAAGQTPLGHTQIYSTVNEYWPGYDGHTPPNSYGNAADAPGGLSSGGYQRAATGGQPGAGPQNSYAQGAAAPPFAPPAAPTYTPGDFTPRPYTQAAATARAQYAAQRRHKRVRAPKRHTVFIALLAAVSLLATTGAVRAGGEGAVVTGKLAMEDFNIYQQGQQLLDVNDALAGTFWFSFAESYNLDPAKLSTARGVQLGQADTALLEPYGHLPAAIEYQCGRVGNYLPEAQFEHWRQSGQYYATYAATFRLFTVNGRVETDETRIQRLYGEENSAKALAEYGLTFQVENGVVTDIECYTHPLE